MLGDNPQEQNRDEELEKARKSMGSRVDPDPTPEPEKKEEETPPAPAPEKKPESEGKKDIKEEKPTPPSAHHDDDDNKNHQPRSERFIPLKKWHDRETEHKTEVKILNEKIAELTSLAGQNPGEKKDEDIEAFMEKTGFDKETVEGLLALAEKRVLTPELKEAIQKAQLETKEIDLETKFEAEFKDQGEPALKTYLPDVTLNAEQLAKAQEFLDGVAHTKEFADKPLDYVIFKHLKEIKEVIGEIAPAGNDAPPQNKKTMEGIKPGAGNQPTFSAKDFVGKKDFSELKDMDPAVATALVKTFDNTTYQNYYAWVKGQNEGVEVMRDGRKVTLK